MPVMDYYRQYTEGPDFDHIGREGYGGVFCIETGGPTPGLAAPVVASLPLSTSSTNWKSLKKYRPMSSCTTSWATFVCGGFSAPIRDGYADEIFIVTSGEKMALYAAANYL